MRTAFKSMVLGAAWLAAGTASGHARLVQTEPAADATLSTAPASVVLTFNEPVRLAVLKLASGDHAIPVAVDRKAAAAARVTVPLPSLAAGRYQVEWGVLTAGDGHAVKGTFSFSIR